MTMQRLEVMGSVDRRRRWPRVEKERLVAAAFEPGASISEVARSAGLHASQLFRWRKDLCQPAAQTGHLLPVQIEPDRSAGTAQEPPKEARERRHRSSSLIEIELGPSLRVRIDQDVDPEALRRVLDVLATR
jgi:transposase